MRFGRWIFSGFVSDLGCTRSGSLFKGAFAQHVNRMKAYLHFRLWNFINIDLASKLSRSQSGNRFVSTQEVCLTRLQQKKKIQTMTSSSPTALKLETLTKTVKTAIVKHSNGVPEDVVRVVVVWLSLRNTFWLVCSVLLFQTTRFETPYSSCFSVFSQNQARFSTLEPGWMRMSSFESFSFAAEYSEAPPELKRTGFRFVSDLVLMLGRYL